MAITTTINQIAVKKTANGIALTSKPNLIVLRSGAYGAQGVPGLSTIRTVHTFALQGPIQVASIPGFFASMASNETDVMAKARYRIGSGTNVTFKIQKNGSDWSGYGTTGSPLTATTTPATTTQTNSIAEDDFITLVLLGISGSPSDLSVTLVFEHTT